MSRNNIANSIELVPPKTGEQDLSVALLAAGRGFEVVYGFARPGGSQALNAKFGAVFLSGFPNWHGSGEEFRRYRLALK